MRKYYHIKEDRWEDFCNNYQQYGFIDHRTCFYKDCGRRELRIWVFNKEITDYVYDPTTYSKVKYEGEYRHNTKRYIEDLISDGYVEVRNEE